MSQKPELTLIEVQQLFEGWRSRRKRHERIPGALWDAAISLSRHLSANRIAKLLRLNHTAVRNHIQAHKEREESKQAPTFVELDMPIEPAAGECTIEMEKPGGLRMKICCKGNCPDLVGISKAFFGEA